MREVIRKQLNKIKNVEYTYDEESRVIHFLKQEKTEFKVGGIYMVELDNQLLTDTSSLLYTNYNNCQLPISKYLMIEVQNILGGKYMKVNANALTEELTPLNKMWSGYLLCSKVKVLSINN